MKKIIKWLDGLLKDEKGSPSSKRFIGIICTLSLIVTMFIAAFSKTPVVLPSNLVESVALLAFGGLGLSSVDKFTKMKNDVNNAVGEKEIVEEIQ